MGGRLGSRLPTGSHHGQITDTPDKRGLLRRSMWDFVTLPLAPHLLHADVSRESLTPDFLSPICGMRPDPAWGRPASPSGLLRVTIPKRNPQR